MRPFVLLLVALATSASAVAQPSGALSPSLGDDALSLEVRRTFDETREGVTLIPVALLLEYQSRPFGAVRIHTVATASYYYSSFEGESNTGFTVGNLYAGGTVDGPHKGEVSTQAGVGVWIPTSRLSEDFEAVTASIFGGRAVPTRPAAFWIRATTLSSHVDVQWQGRDGIQVGARLSPQVLLPMSDPDPPDQEPRRFILGYEAAASAPVGPVRATLSLGGATTRQIDEDVRAEGLGPFVGLGVEGLLSRTRLSTSFQTALTESGAQSVFGIGAARSF